MNIRAPLIAAKPATRADAGVCVLLLGIAVGLFADVLFSTGEVFGRDLDIHRSLELYNRRAWAAGQMPLWNSHEFAGTPALGDLVSAVFYPLTLVLWWVPIDRLYAVLFVVHMWLVGVGVYLLCRESGASRGASCIAAIGLSLGGYIAPRVFAGHLAAILGWTWLPWALWFAVRHVRSGVLWPSPGVTACIALSFFAGWVQGAIYSAGAVALYYLLSAVWPIARPASGSAALAESVVVSGWWPLAQLLVVGTAVVGLAAVQLLPARVLAEAAGRSVASTVEFAAGGARSLDWNGVVSTMAPRLEGVRGPTHADSPYVGSLLLVLVPFAWLHPARRREAAFFTLLAVVALAFAFGRHLPLYSLHMWLLPGMRIPLRFLALWAVAVAVLGSLGLDRLAALAREVRRARLAAAAAFAALGSVCYVLILGDAAATTGLANAVRALGGDLGRGAIQVASPLLIAVLVAFSLHARWLVLALGMLLVVEVVPYARSYITVERRGENVVERALAGLPVGRALSLCENAVGPTQFMDAGYDTIEGYTALTLRAYARFSYIAAGAVVPETIQAQRFSAVGRLPPRRDLLDFLNVTHVVSCRPVEGTPGLRLVRQVDGQRVYENTQAWPRAVWMCPQEVLPSGRVFQRLIAQEYTSNRTLRALPLQIVVAWRPEATEPEREGAASAHGLVNPWLVSASAWRYDLRDPSSGNVAALARHPAVGHLQAHGPDLARPLGAVEPMFGGLVQATVSRPEPDPELRALSHLAGSRACQQQASVGPIELRPSDGRLRVVVDAPIDGLLVTSEPYYRERRALIDGRPVETARVNGAFIGVPLPAGRHTVEIGYAPRTFYAGASISAATVGVLFFGWARGRRRRRQPPLPHAVGGVGRDGDQ